MGLPSTRYRELAGAKTSELRRIHKEGARPSVSAIDGSEFYGLNHPRLFVLLGIRKFVKAFFSTGADSDYGCNTPVKQNGVEAEWLEKPSAEAPKRYGFFSVGPASDRHPNGLLLDYSQGHNSFWQPARFLRDYVVRVDPESDDLLLGKAYLALGPLRVPVCFFLLERRGDIAVQPRLPA